MRSDLYESRSRREQKVKGVFNMRKIGISSIVVLVLIALFMGGLGLSSVSAQTTVQSTADNQVTRTVSVSGSGSVSVQPDAAVVVVGVRTEAEEASAALNQNSQEVTALLNALQQAGITPDNIQTQHISLSPRYGDVRETPGQPQVTGYIATNTVQVRVADIAEVGQLLDTVVQAGSNLIENIRFEVSDPTQNLQQAREQAFNNARQKAEQLASLAGGQLGMVVSISETSFQLPPPFGRGGADFAVQQAVPVEPGTQNVQVDLHVTWELTGVQTGAGATQVIPQTGSGTTTPFVTPTRSAVTLIPPAGSPTAPASSPTAGATSTTPLATTQATTAPTDNDASAAGQLRANGATVQSLGTILQPFFPVVGQVLNVNGNQVQVFEFESVSDAQQTVNTITQTSSFLRNLNPNSNLLPSVFHNGEIVVLYAGTDQETLDLLTQTFGAALSINP
jgi:uncharacterized protein